MFGGIFVNYFCVLFTLSVALFGNYVNCRQDLGFASSTGPQGTEPVSTPRASVFVSAELLGHGVTHVSLWLTLPVSQVVLPILFSQQQRVSVPDVSTFLPALGGVI